MLLNACKLEEVEYRNKNSCVEVQFAHGAVISYGHSFVLLKKSLQIHNNWWSGYDESPCAHGGYVKRNLFAIALLPGNYGGFRV